MRQGCSCQEAVCLSYRLTTPSSVIRALHPDCSYQQSLLGCLFQNRNEQLQNLGGGRRKHHRKILFLYLDPFRLSKLPVEIGPPFQVAALSESKPGIVIWGTSEGDWTQTGCPWTGAVGTRTLRPFAGWQKPLGLQPGFPSTASLIQPHSVYYHRCSWLIFLYQFIILTYINLFYKETLSQMEIQYYLS